MIQYRLSLTVVCHVGFFDKYRIDHTKDEYIMQRMRGVCTTYVKRNCARDSGQSLFARNGHLGT